MYRELLNKIKVFSIEEFKKATEETRDYIDRMTDEDFKSVVREIGTIPENIEHDSMEEKLYFESFRYCACQMFPDAGTCGEKSEGLQS